MNRRTRAVLATARALLLPAVLVGTTGCQAPAPAGSGAASQNPAPEPDWFEERALAAGLVARHTNGMSGGFLFPEIMGSGIALLDYDNDGDLDVYVVQGGPLRSAGLDAPEAEAPGDRLFRNDLVVDASGRRTLRFVDVTRASGLAPAPVAHGHANEGAPATPWNSAGVPARGTGMGVAAGDVDNDGCMDLYVTRYGRNSLLRNRCDGTFEDRTAASGTGHDGWSVSATFFDFDRDGWLDLYVTDYVTYRLESHTDCVTPSGKPDYCSPSAFRPRPGQLFRNNRNGTFTNVTGTSKIGTAFGPGLGAIAADVNGDGWPDLYVANDGQDNQLWINRHDGTFAETGLLAGVAVNGAGRAEASMGVDAGDVDGDGDEDLFITNLTAEGHTLYVNDGTGVFEDGATRAGIRSASLPYTGFGTALVDLDNDGWLDIVTVNGAVRVVEALEQRGDAFPFAQPRQVFRNRGDGRFEDVTARAGRVFAEAEVSRGAAFGDVDNDGDVDVVVANNNGPVRLLLNTRGHRSPWLGLRLVGRDTRRDMLGARVAVTRDDGRVLWRRAHADGSYGSAGDPRILVGLAGGRAATVRVRWPGGREEQWPAPPAGRYTTLVEGTGR